MKRDTATFVIGHINPDTDAVASAMGYTWLLNNTRQGEFVAARAGHLNPQTRWVLSKLELEPPLYMRDASPNFDVIMHRVDTTTPDQPLREAWQIAARTGGVAPLLNANGTPYGMVTAQSLTGFLIETIGTHAHHEELRVRELLNRSCRDVCDVNVPKFHMGSRIRDSLPRILREERDAFFVVNEEGAYVGVCWQREALNPPRINLILVDHNEPDQALAALDEADLEEILDHHRLGNASTRMPIRFTVDVVGSTSTLVAERIYAAGLSAPPVLAGLLLAGLISDTLLLSSPTTTERDHAMARRLSRWALVPGSPLADETLESFADGLLRAGAGLGTREPADVVSADFKRYESSGVKFGVAQVEVTNLVELVDHLEPLRDALDAERERFGLGFVMLMVTDIVLGSSRLVLSGRVPGLDELPYPHLPDGTLDAPDVVSRKKQLLPTILSALSS
ncbi:MAG: DHH family phosphoesterase [Anaerolineae bacterium]|nr:DHH family phosphoesterase [Anaerolineae bacterium]